MYYSSKTKFWNKISDLSFDKASDTYEDRAFVQRMASEILAKFAKNFVNDIPVNISSILDVGTGTGNTAFYAMNEFPLASLSINDISANMLKFSEEKLLKYAPKKISGDFDNINFKYHDMIISNFSIQWSSNAKILLKKLWKKCNLLCISTLVNGTFSEIDNILRDFDINSKFNIYPDHDEYLNIISQMDNCKFRIMRKAYELKFNCLSEFFEYIKCIGANHPKFKLSVSDTRKLIKIKNKQLNIFTHYEVLFLVACHYNEGSK